MECSTWSCRRPSRKHSARRGNRFSRLSVCRSNKAPPSELIVPPSNWATISREPKASNPKRDWLHSVIAEAVLSLAPTVVWKLSYAMKDGFLPIVCENCGLELRFIGRRAVGAGHRDVAQPQINTELGPVVNAVIH